MSEDKQSYVGINAIDLQGVPRPFEVPKREYNESSSLQIDGSSIKGFQVINDSDLTLNAVSETEMLEDVEGHKSLFVLGELFLDPEMKKPYDKDPRQVAKKAIRYMQATGVADTANFAPEAEFYLFDKVAFHTSGEESFFSVDTKEGDWHNKTESQGHKALPNYSYSQPAPIDTQKALRYQLSDLLDAAKLKVEALNAEVGPAQNEINVKYADMVTAADHLLKLKYIVKNFAESKELIATFMPKPLGNYNGSGMHTNMSLFKAGKNVFYDEKGTLGLSKYALYFIGGIIKHAGAIAAFTNPSVNSYQRLVPGYEAPVALTFSGANRSAGIRIPKVNSEMATRVEARFPDPLANGYLAFSALLLAGLDGIENKIDPGKPATVDLFEDAKGVKMMPGSLQEAVAALKADQEFLMKGNVFSKSLLSSYIELLEDEITSYVGQPHPLDFVHALSR